MSWCGGGLISATPGVECRTLAIQGQTLWPGSCPPSPGLAPCAILIWSSSALTRYSLVTPNRPEATCLIALRLLSPLGNGLYRAESSPPSPVLLLPPSRFMAMARVSCASPLIEPYDIAPVANRLTIDSIGSTSSIGIGWHLLSLKSKRPRSVQSRSFWSSTACEYFLKMSKRPDWVACWSRKTVSGLNRWYSPSRRHWYWPPSSRSVGPTSRGA